MTIFFEASGPVQWKPFHFASETMVRVGWLFFAIGWLRVPFRKFSETSYDWYRQSPNW
jgi:hypothetical protein